MREIRLDRLTDTFINCTDTFYQHLTDYFHLMNSLC